MKNILITLLLIISFLTTKAQDYLPIAVEDANWLIYATESDGLPPFNDYYFGYKIKGDTIINSIDYKKVYYQSYERRPSDEGPETLPLTFKTLRLFGAIRDDIPNKKVYGIQFCDEVQNQTDCPCDIEFLMYDFSMEINDLYIGQCITEGAAYFLQDIQQEFIFGQLRNVQIVQIESPHSKIYEGVGGFSGLFNFVNVFIECFNGPSCLELVHYCVGTNEECLSGFVTLALEENNLETLFSIYPNPVKNILVIENKLNINIKSIKLYDLLGKEIITTNNTSIDTSNLYKGIYILQINTEQGSITKKIIKS